MRKTFTMVFVLCAVMVQLSQTAHASAKIINWDKTTSKSIEYGDLNSGIKESEILEDQKKSVAASLEKVNTTLSKHSKKESTIITDNSTISSNKQVADNGSNASYNPTATASERETTSIIGGAHNMSAEKLANFFKKNYYPENCYQGTSVFVEGGTQTAQAFIDASNQYGIELGAMVGIAIQETGWGGSKLAHTKSNFGGINAINGDEENASYSYNGVANGVIGLAQFLRDKWVRGNPVQDTLDKIQHASATHTWCCTELNGPPSEAWQVDIAKFWKQMDEAR